MNTYDEDSLKSLLHKLQSEKQKNKLNESAHICPSCYSVYLDDYGCSCDNDD